jgi:small subunit ribosomal protein S18
MAARYFRRKKVTKITPENEATVDYKNVPLLREYVSETGAVLPARITSASSRHQRMLKREIKKARFLALLPYSDAHDT